jgi:hypothetical protein
MCLNARQVFYEGGADTTILLGIEDVTAQRALEREKEDLIRQKGVLLEEMQHLTRDERAEACVPQRQE